MVIALMGIISGIVFVGLRPSQKTLLLDRAGHQVGQDIRRMMDLALRAEPFEDCPGSSDHYGYAIHFATDDYNTDNFGHLDDEEARTSYLLYALCDNDFEYDDDDHADMELIQLESGIEIKMLLGEDGPEDEFDVAFEPPDPTLHFEPNDPPLVIIVATENASIIGYEYTQTGVETGWCGPVAACEGNNTVIGCPSTFSATSGDPSVVYDQYCIGGSCGGSASCGTTSSTNKQSLIFTKIPIYSPSKVITVSEKGVIEVQ